MYQNDNMVTICYKFFKTKIKSVYYMFQSLKIL